MSYIHILPPSTARLIAAGEVIDRPAAVLRELLDNAIDAKADNIQVRLEGGGIDLIEVVDNGSGMDKEDLSLCILPHATSKIKTADDLLHTTSLGFRGEALPSIIAIADLEVISKNQNQSSGYKLSCPLGLPSALDPIASLQGTRVCVTNLFINYPARKKFLKRPQSELALCKNIFYDKALAHPSLTFRFGKDNPLCPGTGTERIRQVFPFADTLDLREIAIAGQGISGKAIVALPSYLRSDRKYMQLFVNGRRVVDWNLLQALDFSFADYLPGSSHPFAFLFLEVDPALVDFNIHPAKKELRFKFPDDARHAVISGIKSHFKELGITSSSPTLANIPTELAFGRYNDIVPSPSFTKQKGHDISWQHFDEVRESRSKDPQDASVTFSATNALHSAQGFRYLGQALGCFLLFENQEGLWLLDLHAAHERILFNELQAAPLITQDLLVDEVYEPASDIEDNRIKNSLADLEKAGFRIRQEGSDWLIQSVPAGLQSSGAEALKEILSENDDILKASRAVLACHGALRQGTQLQEVEAEKLIHLALQLPEPRCPHGRPIWFCITKEMAFKLVRRTI